MFAVIDGGTYYHWETIHGARYRHLFDRVIYGPELTAGALEDVSVLLVPDRVNPQMLRPHTDLLLAHLNRGRTLAVLGENEFETWLPGTNCTPRETNFWWWLDKDARPPHQFHHPDHELFTHIAPRDTVWHIHGVMQAPEGADVMVSVPPDGKDDGGALLYDDRVSYPGRLILSTLDPFYHNGSHFMPATTRMLNGFLPWLRTLAPRERAAA